MGVFNPRGGGGGGAPAEHTHTAAEVEDFATAAAAVAAGVGHTAAQIADFNTAVDNRISGFGHRAVNMAFPGDVLPPGEGGYALPGAWVMEPSGRTLKIIAARYAIDSGTSVTFNIMLNGVTTVAAGLVADAGGVAGDLSDFADVDLADGDRLSVVVTAVAGLPVGLAVGLLLAVT